MRESVGLAANAHTLQWKEFSEGDIDRLTALAYAGKISPLGEDLCRLIIARDGAALPRSMRLLAERLRPPADKAQWMLPTTWRLAIAKQAIGEIVEPHCRVCAGAGQKRAENGVLIVCVKCDGHGGHRHSDEERALGIGVDIKVYRPKISGRMEYAMEVLSRELYVVNQELRTWLP